MLMVILGAGASYDSSQEYRPVENWRVDEWWRPPLAKDLFLDRHHQLGTIITTYPKLSPILPLLREPPKGKSVEEFLEALQGESKDYSERLRQLLSVRYYIRDLLWQTTNQWIARTNGITNYAPLLDQILRRHKSDDPVCLVTFNYDLLLENALQTFDFKKRQPADHLDSHPIFKVFRLHGSVAWARFVEFPVNPQLSPAGLIDSASSLKLSNEYALWTFGPTENGRLIVPAIAIPVQTKTEETFECPPQHLERLKELTKSVTKILIIGWQAREAHFLNMLRTRLPLLEHIMVVTANAHDATKVLTYFKGQLGHVASKATTNVVNAGFTDFVLNEEGDEFFKA
jgi:hypothetical protein